MNLQHSQWNHLLGFGGLARKVAKSDSNIINEYYGHMRSNRPRLRYPCSTADDGFGQPYTIQFNSEAENFVNTLKTSRRLLVFQEKK